MNLNLWVPTHIYIKLISVYVDVIAQILLKFCITRQWLKQLTGVQLNAHDDIIWTFVHILASVRRTSLIARSMGPTWVPSGDDRTQVGPMLATWNLLSGILVASGFPLQRASNARIWHSCCCKHMWAVEKAVQLLVILDTIRTSHCHYNVYLKFHP